MSVRGMREITKREQVVTYMKKKSSIDLLCLQETKIPSSSIEQRDSCIFVFSTSEAGGTDHHGVGFSIIGKLKSTWITTSNIAVT